MNNILKQRKRHFSIVLMHVLVWLVLFIIPYLLSYENPDVLTKMMQHSGLTLFLYGILFYSNYFFLIEKYYFNKKNGVFIIVNVLLVVVFSYLLYELKGTFHEAKPPMNLDEFGRKIRFSRPPKGIFVYLDSLAFFVPIVFSMVLKISSQWRKNEEKSKEIERMKFESELKYLKHQLQPHFFFNTINNIYALIDVSSADAKKSLHKLGKLMRYLLYHTSEKYASLKDELQFLENFIELMKLRVSDNVVILVDFPEVKDLVKIPPLLFLSLVENSFKHGIDAIAESTIKISLKLEGEKIRFQSINLFIENTSEDKSEKGIGVSNLKRRLELLYGNNYTLVNERRGDEYYTELEIPVHYE